MPVFIISSGAALASFWLAILFHVLWNSFLGFLLIIFLVFVIPTRNVHSIRHTFATRMLERGVQPIVVSRLVGHASIQITMDLYGHVIPDFAEQELEKMEEIYV